MKGLDLGALTKALAKHKYALLVLCVGLGLLLLPRRTSDGAAPAETAAAYSASGAPMAASGIPVDTESERIAALLRHVRGVGDAQALLSAGGCVVVCEGADDPAVRLDVTNAVAAYTGLGSDKICIIKMNSGGSGK